MKRLICLLGVSISLQSAMRDTSEFAVLTVPKCGTSLLHKICEEVSGGKTLWNIVGLGRSSGELRDLYSNLDISDERYYCAHFIEPLVLNTFFESRPQSKVLVLVRDPRDAVVSCVDWLDAEQREIYFESFAQISSPEEWNRFTFSEKLLQVIRASEFELEPISVQAESLSRQFRVALNFSRSPQALLLYYEDLVGPKGGGDQTAQIEAIKSIGEFIQAPMTHEKAAELAKNCFGGTSTFNKGTIGRWRDHFEEVHIQYFKQHFGSTLIDLGYEEDLNW